MTNATKPRFFVISAKDAHEPHEGGNPNLWTVGERLNEKGLWFPLNYTIGWFGSKARAEERAAAFNGGVR